MSREKMIAKTERMKLTFLFRKKEILVNRNYTCKKLWNEIEAPLKIGKSK